MSSWDRQVNSDGDTVADAALSTGEFIANERLGAVVAYLDLIADCLVALAWQALPDHGRRDQTLREIRDDIA